MKYILLCFIFLQLLFINHASSITVYAETADQTPISIYEEDLTNDGFKETIELEGRLLSEKSGYFQSISARIETLDSKQWQLNFSGGYEPKIHFLDLNHNGTNDLFYESSKKDHAIPYDQHLYSFKNDQLTEIPLPKQPFIEGKFKDDFYIHIHLAPPGNLRPTIFNIDHQAKKYIGAGIYHPNGKLMESKQMTVKPISHYEPIKISKKKGYGLKSYQPGYGADHTDHLGTIETLWYYENNRWIILQTNWVAA